MPPRIVDRSFRVSDIPSTWNSAETIKQLAAECKAVHATVINLELYPDIDSERHLQVGIITLSGISGDLTRFGQAAEHLKPRAVKIGDIMLRIDLFFQGLTSLNNTVGEPIADVVAVTGLAGNAYGSWKDRATSNMWLKDFLPESLNNRVRVMTYGYPTPLTEESSFVINLELSDFVRHLIGQITTARKSAKNRPLILIGHSLGGILIARMLLYCMEEKDQRYKYISDASDLVVFFGSPHGGLHTKELLDMVTQSQSSGGGSLSARRLLEMLQIDSAYLVKHREQMQRTMHNRKVISFFETVKSPTVIQNPGAEKWAKDGPLAKMVDQASAQLNTNREVAIPIARDHSDIAKISSTSDKAYSTVIAGVDSVLKNSRRP